MHKHIFSFYISHVHLKLTHCGHDFAKRLRQLHTLDLVNSIRVLAIVHIDQVFGLLKHGRSEGRLHTHRADLEQNHERVGKDLQLRFIWGLLILFLAFLNSIFDFFLKNSDPFFVHLKNREGGDGLLQDRIQLQEWDANLQRLVHRCLEVGLNLALQFLEPVNLLDVVVLLRLCQGAVFNRPVEPDADDVSQQADGLVVFDSLAELVLQSDQLPLRFEDAFNAGRIAVDHFLELLDLLLAVFETEVPVDAVFELDRCSFRFNCAEELFKHIHLLVGIASAHSFVKVHAVEIVVTIRLFGDFATDFHCEIKRLLSLIIFAHLGKHKRPVEVKFQVAREAPVQFIVGVE